MKLINKLNQFSSIQFEDFAQVSIDNSQESKFILSAKKLNKVLEEIKDQYHILEIRDKRIFKYTTEYFDTDDFQLYLAHHNGNGNRYLIKNNEVEGLKKRSFEIKHQSNRGEISKLKQKTKSDQPEDVIIDTMILQNTPFKPASLKKMLKNQFYRIVLVNKALSEKISIDIDLRLSSVNNKIKLPYLAIVELKQTKFSLSSDFMSSLRKHNIQKTSLNKYCIGIALLNNDIKKNKFKSKLLAISKINGTKSYTELNITA